MQEIRQDHVRGIDVSHYQQTIDWSKVRDSGMAYTFIKASEGVRTLDAFRTINASGAGSVGIKTGFYHYAHPELNAPQAEAAHFAAAVAGLDAAFPHVLDLEGQAASIGATALTQWAISWLEDVRKRTAHPVMIYTGASFARTYLGAELGKYPLWVAHYGVNKPMSNSTWSTWSVFQYTDRGNVNGIKGNVDMNMMEPAFFNLHAGAAKPWDEKDDTPVTLNGQLAAYGRNLNGHIHVPIRQLGPFAGATIGWDHMNKRPLWDGQAVDPFVTIGQNVYISTRTAAALLGGTANWNAGKRQVEIVVPLS